jgi:hypothetical protein
MFTGLACRLHQGDDVKLKKLQAASSGNWMRGGWEDLGNKKGLPFGNPIQMSSSNIA